MDMIQFGLGPIGVGILRMAYKSEKINLIGAIDVDPSKVGEDIGTLLGEPQLNQQVSPSVRELNARDGEGAKKVAIHATGSNLEKVWPQIKGLLDSDFSVVSTCEELAYPWHRYPELSEEIDEYCKERELSVLGTGVNPGFIMDALVLCLTAVESEVSSVHASRKVDVAKRRLPLQQKVGVGMSREAFKKSALEEKIGHVGLEESVRLVAYGLNWSHVEVKNTIEPTISETSESLPLTALEKGDVDGLHQTSVGQTADGKEVKLDLTMRVGVEQQDEITVEGSERHQLLIPGGIFGDAATAAMALNCSKVLGSSPSGLLNMADVLLPRSA